MPYIMEKRRIAISYSGAAPINAGELNYAITKLLVRYVRTNELSYQTINDIVGALEGAKAEFQRRIVVPYETQKCITNGDVYGPF